MTAKVQRIVFDRDVATGVEILAEDGIGGDVLSVNRGVILCAGAIHSPAILIQSGIGPEGQLRANDAIIVQVHQNVGANLSDHLIVPVIFSTIPEFCFPSEPTGDERFSNLAEVGGLIRFDDDRSVQFHVTPTHYLTYPQASAPAAITLGVNGCRPYSRGSLRVCKSRPSSAWSIEVDPGFLSDSRDLEAILSGVELARAIARHADLSPFVVDELIPGGKRQSPESILRSIERFAQTLYHPTGTCRMGIDGSSVVDEQLAVRGVDGLYVIDGSILPTIPSVNPNATVMTVAMHGAKAMICRYR